MCRALRGALPRAPPAEQQTVHDPAILHTTLARLLRLPRASAGRMLRSGAPDGAALLRSAVARISADLCGLRATLPTLWCTYSTAFLESILPATFQWQPCFPFWRSCALSVLHSSWLRYVCATHIMSWLPEDSAAWKIVKQC